MDTSLLPNLGEPSIDNGANSEESPMKACFERADFLAKALMAAFGIIVVAALGGYKDIVKKPLDSLTRATALFLILTYLSSFVLGLYVNNMSNHINLTSWQYMLHVVLVSFGGVCLMCTNVLLLALVNWVNGLLGCFLVVMLFVIGMLAYVRSRINNTNHLPRDKAFKAAMKSCCDVAYLTVGSAFPMHVGVVFVYYNNPSLRVNQLPPVDISVTFLASILGVFSMMITAMPLELLPLAVTSKLLSLVKFLNYSMLFLTSIAALILGGKFLDGMILLTLMPILVVIVAYQAMLLLTRQQVNSDPNNVGNEDPENPEQVDPPNNVNEEREMPSMLTAVMNSCIVLLSAVYALHNGDENGDVYLRVGIFVLVGIITTCLSGIALLLNPSMNKQRANVIKLIISILVGLMTTIAASFLVKICFDLFYQTK